MKYICQTFIVAVFFQLSVQAQKQFANNYTGWYMYFGSHKISERFGFHLEAQWRRNELVLSPQQLLLRTGINYHFNKQIFATLGYCFVETYPYGAFPVKSTFPENRIWQQVQLKTKIKKIEMINRFRLEQRFVNLPVSNNVLYLPGPAVYFNRFRLLSRISLPFKGQEIEDKRFYATTYLELFCNFGFNVEKNIYDQNRSYLALGYKMPKLGRLEIGYLNQLLFKSDGIKVENNHTLQVGLISNFDFYGKKT